ncbi:MAG: hypothetical protein VX444_00255 [Pseudomonadota bacterium]|nr:hypothetical protein [Pseudomonadota bacterium]
MPIWLAYLGFPIGLALIALAVWKPDAANPWYDPERPKALVWGVVILATALDAAIFGYLPIWGE